MARRPDEGMEMRHSLTPFSQELRKNQTKEEARLWYQFLRKYPYQFRRQHPLGKYIADFYCAKAKLVVELDGAQYYGAEVMDYDAQRTAYLESLDLCVLRFSNADINIRFQNVCTAIDQTVKERLAKGV